MRIIHEGRGGYIEIEGARYAIEHVESGRFCIHARPGSEHLEELQTLVASEPEKWALVGGGSWWVYVLLSADEARTYVGITTDVERRLRQHNGELVGGARSTRAGRPWGVAARHGPYPARGEATRHEAAIKRLRGRHRLTWPEPGPKA